MPDVDGRLFCFGCSVTQYHWPTWADIVGTQWKQFENWGEKGAGNQFIFNSIIECDAKNKFNKNDTLAIMWSNPVRQDYFCVNKWTHHTDTLSENNELSHCLDGYWLTTFSYIYAIDQLLKNRGVDYRMFSWIDFKTSDSKFDFMFEDLINKISFVELSLKSNQVYKMENIQAIAVSLYKALSGPDWPTLESIMNNNYSTTAEIENEIQLFWWQLNNDPRTKISGTKQLDSHPLPSEHFAICKKMFPDLEFSQQLQQWVRDLDAQIKNGQYVHFDKKMPDKSYYNLKEKNYV